VGDFSLFGLILFFEKNLKDVLAIVVAGPARNLAEFPPKRCRLARSRIGLPIVCTLVPARFDALQH